MKIYKTDILIIGAGPSGTVAAAHLLKEGWSVRIIEKSNFPRFSIGESLIPRCMEHFEEVGLLDILKKQGFQEKHGARFIRGKEVCLFDFHKQFSEGWEWTWQVPRADFDSVLSQEVQNRGAIIDFEATIAHIDFQATKSKVFIENKNGEKHLIKTKFIIDASGFGRVIPKMLGLEKQADFPVKQTIFAHFKDINRPKDETGNLITFVVHQRDLWFWVIPFSNGNTSVGVVGMPEYFEKFEDLGDIETQFRTMISEVPQINSRFKNVPIQFEPKSMKAWSVASEKLFGEGFIITGNSWGFLDPIFSSGVTFATESGLLAAKLVSRKLKGEHIDWQKEYVEHLENGTNVFKTYVNAWYDGSLQDIFFFSSLTKSYLAQTNMTEIKKQICSVLAGYVWDKKNPYVRRPQKAMKALARIIEIYK